MSWDSYIDNLVAQTKDASGQAHTDKACIIGLDGGAGWTTAAHANHLNLSGTEGATIANCFKNKDFTHLMANGVFVGGTKYQFLREEDGRVVYAKKKGEGALTLQCSKTAIVIAHSGEGCQQGNQNKGVGVIADYLESMNM